MKVYDPAALARAAVAPPAGRPATSLVHDSSDARVVLFRLEPGQAVPTHTSSSTVLLSIVAGRGFVSGNEGERAIGPGEWVGYAPHEPHGMRADTEQFVIAAVIAPRPG